MNWYLFAIECFGLVALLMAFSTFLNISRQWFVAQRKAEETRKMVRNICEDVVGKIIVTMGDEARDLMDYAMDKTKKMVEDTFKTDES